MPDREPAAWAGVDKNVNNDTYALADGTIIRRDNDLTKLYNRVYGKIYRVKRRGDRRVIVYESVLLIFYSMVISDLRHYHSTVLFVQYGPNFGTKDTGLWPQSDQNCVKTVQNPRETTNQAV